MVGCSSSRVILIQALANTAKSHSTESRSTETAPQVMFSKILLLFISLSFDVVLGSLADSRMTGRVKGNPDGFDSDTTLAFLMLGRYKKG